MKGEVTFPSQMDDRPCHSPTNPHINFTSCLLVTYWVTLAGAIILPVHQIIFLLNDEVSVHFTRDTRHVTCASSIYLINISHLVVEL